LWDDEEMDAMMAELTDVMKDVIMVVVMVALLAALMVVTKDYILAEMMV